MPTATDPMTEAAVDQLDRLINLARNARRAFTDGDPDVDPLATARLIAVVADAGDRLVVQGPECFP